MSKNKAILCTTLMLIVIAVVLTLSNFVRNEEYGLNLYNILMSAIAYLNIGSFLGKFYEWLIK